MSTPIIIDKNKNYELMTVSSSAQAIAATETTTVTPVDGVTNEVSNINNSVEDKNSTHSYSKKSQVVQDSILKEAKFSFDYTGANNPQFISSFCDEASVLIQTWCQDHQEEWTAMSARSVLTFVLTPKHYKNWCSAHELNLDRQYLQELIDSRAWFKKDQKAEDTLDYQALFLQENAVQSKLEESYTNKINQPLTELLTTKQIVLPETIKTQLLVISINVARWRLRAGSLVLQNWGTYARPPASLVASEVFVLSETNLTNKRVLKYIYKKLKSISLPLATVWFDLLNINPADLYDQTTGLVLQNSHGFIDDVCDVLYTQALTPLVLPPVTAREAETAVFSSVESTFTSVLTMFIMQRAQTLVKTKRLKGDELAALNYDLKHKMNLVSHYLTWDLPVILKEMLWYNKIAFRDILSVDVWLTASGIVGNGTKLHAVAQTHPTPVQVTRPFLSSTLISSAVDAAEVLLTSKNANFSLDKTRLDSSNWSWDLLYPAFEQGVVLFLPFSAPVSTKTRTKAILEKEEAGKKVSRKVSHLCTIFPDKTTTDDPFVYNKLMRKQQIFTLKTNNASYFLGRTFFQALLCRYLVTHPIWLAPLKTLSADPQKKAEAVKIKQQQAELLKTPADTAAYLAFIDPYKEDFPDVLVTINTFMSLGVLKDLQELKDTIKTEDEFKDVGLIMNFGGQLLKHLNGLFYNTQELCYMSVAGQFTTITSYIPTTRMLTTYLNFNRPLVLTKPFAWPFCSTVAPQLPQNTLVKGVNQRYVKAPIFVSKSVTTETLKVSRTAYNFLTSLLFNNKAPYHNLLWASVKALGVRGDRTLLFLWYVKFMESEADGKNNALHFVLFNTKFVDLFLTNNPLAKLLTRPTTKAVTIPNTSSYYFYLMVVNVTNLLGLPVNQTQNSQAVVDTFLVETWPQLKNEAAVTNLLVEKRIPLEHRPELIFYLVNMTAVLEGQVLQFDFLLKYK